MLQNPRVLAFLKIAVFGLAVSVIVLAANLQRSIAQQQSPSGLHIVTDSDRIKSLEASVTKLTAEITAIKKQQVTDETAIASTRPPQGWNRAFGTFHTIKSEDDQKIALYYMSRP